MRRPHLTTICKQVSHNSPLYHFATRSWIESIAWATYRIIHIDDTYNEYVAVKFGTTISWHITTKLAMSLICEAVKPHEGALNSFETENSTSIVLKSLDVMGEISALDYRDSP